MTRTIRILSLVAAAGGAAWLAKFALIAATDGARSGAADGATAILYMLGVALLCAGAASVTLRPARGTAAKAAAIVAAPVLAIASFLVLEAIAKAAVGDAGPSWLADEAGIALTGLVWLGAGLVSRRAAQPVGAALAV